MSARGFVKPTAEFAVNYNYRKILQPEGPVQENDQTLGQTKAYRTVLSWLMSLTPETTNPVGLD